MGLQNRLALGGAVHTHSHGFRMERRSIPPEAEATVAAAEVSHSTLEPPLACTPATAASDSMALCISLCITARGGYRTDTRYTATSRHCTPPSPSVERPVAADNSLWSPQMTQFGLQPAEGGRCWRYACAGKPGLPFWIFRGFRVLIRV